MRAASLKEVKTELQSKSSEELVELCLRLSKFKKENKELLTYLLFDSIDEEEYIKSVKEEIKLQFDEMNISRSIYIRKTTRKILTLLKKYIRYSGNKETEVELLIFYCQLIKNFKTDLLEYPTVENMYVRLKESILKKVEKLHEDLRFDYEESLNSL